MKAPNIYISRVYSSCCCSCSFEPEIIKIGQSSHSNNILKVQESTTILNACTKKSGNLLNAPRICLSSSFFTILSHQHFNMLRPHQESNSQLSNSKSDALSIKRHVYFQCDIIGKGINTLLSPRLSFI